MNEDLINEKFKNHNEKLEDHETRIKTLEKLYTIMGKMEISLKNLQNDVGEMKTTTQANFNNINKKLNEETEQKAFKWEKLIDYLFYALIAYCLYKLGIKK